MKPRHGFQVMPDEPFQIGFSKGIILFYQRLARKLAMAQKAEQSDIESKNSFQGSI